MARTPSIFGPSARLPRLRETASASGAGKDVGSFSMRTQELQFWCWAAVTQAIEHHNGNRVSQAEVAGDHLGKICTNGHDDPSLAVCGDPCEGSCDGQHALSKILDQRGRLNGGSRQDQPTFSFIQQEVAEDRPVPVRIRFKHRGGGQSGHFICVTGWRIGANGEEFVRIHDPLWPGVNQGAANMQEMRFAVLLNNYELTGENGDVNYYYPLK